MIVASVYGAAEAPVRKVFPRLAGANLFAAGEALDLFDGKVQRIEIHEVRASTEARAIQEAGGSRAILLRTIDQSGVDPDLSRRARMASQMIEHLGFWICRGEARGSSHTGSSSLQST